MQTTIRLPGFVGGSYRSSAIYADVQRSINWYPEIVESGQGENDEVLLPTPGSSRFGANAGTADTGSPRGILEYNGQLFMVVGTGFYEVLVDGSFIFRGNVSDDGKPASLSANNVGQVFIAAGRNGYCYGVPEQIAAGSTLPTGFLPILNDGVNFFGASQVVFLDDYFIVLTPDSNQIQVCEINNGTIWNGLSGVQVALVEGQADKLVSLAVDREFLYIYGNRRSEIWYNSGALFPFQIQQGAFIETGIDSAFSVAQADNSLFWVGSDSRGSLVAWRSNGLSPARVSTHAVESAWQGYTITSDVTSFSYQQNGHTFWVINFPTPDTTWVYDLSTKLWHERSYTDAQGNSHVCVAAFHAFAFGKHLIQSSQAVPGANKGQLYEWRTDVYLDLLDPVNVDLNEGAVPIVRDRITPHTYSEDKRYFCNRIELRSLTGVGLPFPPVPAKFHRNVGVLPKMMLRVSRDGGNTFGPEYWVTAGAIGNYSQRLIWNLVGSWRDGVLWFRATDPVNWSLIDCYLTGELGAN